MFFIVFLRKSYPYALLILLMALYNRIDSVMLERMIPGTQGKEQAGIYAQAFRLLDAVSMFGALVAGLLLPIFSKMIKQREPVGEMVKLAYTLLIIPAVIIAVSSVYYDGEIMSLLYKSNTAYSSDILGILMIGFIGIATTYIFGTLLTANGSLKQLNIMAFSGMVLNVILNLILIPRLQAYGSAYASLSTQLFTGAAQLILALVIFRLKPGDIRQMFGKQKVVPGDISVVVTRNAHIKQNVENHGKVEQREIQTIAFVAHHVLHRAVNSKNPEWFNQQVQGKQQDQVCYKFSFQNILNQLVIWLDKKKIMLVVCCLIKW